MDCNHTQAISFPSQLHFSYYFQSYEFDLWWKMRNICYRHFCVDGSRGVEVDIFVASKLIGEEFLKIEGVYNRDKCIIRDVEPNILIKKLAT
ncbi:unnamed protein product [Trifolium pratense]|uniref:Uncharacterized protein n=1 Tax=Trifolium pratense TaxID=57577 RepID=A0ACB0IRU7_TRIPR|nr:unnamed protein product [Trifolium pratense]